MPKKAILFILCFFTSLFIISNASAIIPNPIVSRGKPVVANYDCANAYKVVDGLYSTGVYPPYWGNQSYPSTNNPFWVAIHVGTGASKLMAIIINSCGGNYTETTYGGFGDLQIQVSSNTSNGTNGTWRTVATFVTNKYHSREVSFNFGGYGWVRFWFTAAAAASTQGLTVHEIELYDVSNGSEDTMFFMGDSITAAFSEKQENGMMPCYSDCINMSNSLFYPASQNGGVGGVSAAYGASIIQTVMMLNPDFKYFLLMYGTNDEWGNGTNPYYEWFGNMQSIITQVKNAGRIPVIATIPYASDGAHNTLSQWNVCVAQLTRTNNLMTGPDTFHWFSNHPEQLSDGVHPTPTGAQSYNRLWSQALIGLYKNMTTLIITNIAVNPSVITNNNSRNVSITLKTKSTNATVTNVSIDISSLGGGGFVKMTNISFATLWRYTYSVGTGIVAGIKNLQISALDNQGHKDQNHKAYLTIMPYVTGIVVTNIAATPSSVTNNVGRQVTFSLIAKNIISGQITNVSLNLSLIGGGALTKMTNISAATLWRYSTIVPPGTSPGNLTLKVITLDNKGNVDTNHGIAFTIAPALTTKEIYNDFVIRIRGYVTNNGGNVTEINTGAFEGTRNLQFRYNIVNWSAWCGLNLDNFGLQPAFDATGTEYFRIAFNGPAPGNTMRIQLVASNTNSLVYVLGQITHYTEVDIPLICLTNGTHIDLSRIKQINVSIGGTASGSGNLYMDDIAFVHKTISGNPLTVSGTTVTPAIISNNINRIVIFNLKSVSSAGIVSNVSLNLSQIGGPQTVKMTNISFATLWRYSYTILAGQTGGVKTVPITAKDNSGNLNNGTFAALTVIAAPSGIIVTNISAIPSILTNNFPRVIVFSLKAKDILGGSVTNVSMDLTSINGPSVARMTNISFATLYRYAYSVPSGLGMGIKTIPLWAIDNAGNPEISHSASVTIVTPLSSIIITNLSATPSFVSNNIARNVTFLVTAKDLVSGPITNVSLNLSSLGGPTLVKMTNISSATLWRYTYQVASGFTPGIQSIPFYAMDNPANRKTNTSLTVIVVNVVIPSVSDKIVYTDKSNRISGVLWGTGVNLNLRQTNDGTAWEGTNHWRGDYLLVAGGYWNWGWGISSTPTFDISGATHLHFAWKGPAVGCTPGVAINCNGIGGSTVSFAQSSVYKSTNIPISLFTNGKGMGTPLILQAMSFYLNGPGNQTGTIFLDDIRFVTIVTGSSAPLLPYSPAIGSYNKTASPSFIWSQAAGAVRYWLEIRTNNLSGTIKFSGTNFANTNNTVTALSNGKYVWRAKAFKSSWQSWSSSNSFIIDTAGPNMFALKSPANSGFANSGTPQFTWNRSIDTWSGISGYRIVLDSITNILGNVTNWTPGASIGTGMHNWTVVAQDLAGNRTTASGTWTFTVDTTVPNAPALISPTNNSILASATPNLQWGQSTNNLTNYIVYVDGTAKKTNSWGASNWVTTALTSGIHAWRVKAIDKAGNTNISMTWNFTVPVSGSVSLANRGGLTNSGWNHQYSSSSSMKINLAGADRYILFVNGTKVYSGTGTTNLTGIVAGINQIQVIYSNNNGLTNSSTLSVTYDNQAPGAASGVSINSGAASTTSASVSVSFTITNGSGDVVGWFAGTGTTPGLNSGLWHVNTAGYPVGAKTTNMTLTTGDGTKTVSIWLVDRAGNISPASSDTINLQTGTVLEKNTFHISPNPLILSGDNKNSPMVVEYAVDAKAKAVFEIYTINGTRVVELKDTNSDNKIEWTGVNTAGHQVASGIYLIVMKVDGLVKGTALKIGVLK